MDSNMIYQTWTCLQMILLDLYLVAVAYERQVVGMIGRVVLVLGRGGDDRAEMGRGGDDVIPIQPTASTGPSIGLPSGVHWERERPRTEQTSIPFEARVT